MTITTDQLSNITGASGDVLTSTGDKIGSIGQVYVDDNTGQPSWVTVKTGLFGTSESFVPLEGASLSGSDISVNYDKDKVKDAPRMDADGSLSPEEEETLYAYYGLASADHDRVSDRDVTTTENDADFVNTNDADFVNTNDVATDDVTSRHAHDDLDDTRTQVGHDTSGPTTDDAMTLSEEQLRVGTETRESGRARLRKYVVTENVTKTVPVSHEEVRLEREPITDANVDAATSGPDISEEEHEVILHEERPVVEKNVVATERVRLNTETVTDEATVSEEVRKEEVDTNVDSDPTTR